MSTYRFTRRINTGQYEHDEFEAVESSEVAGEEAHLVAVQKVRAMMAEAYGGLKHQAPTTPKEAFIAVAPVEEQAQATWAPPAVAATDEAEPEIDDAALISFAQQQAVRINGIRAGRGGLEVNAVTKRYVMFPAGLSQIGIIDAEGMGVDPGDKDAVRRAFMAEVEAIQ